MTPTSRRSRKFLLMFLLPALGPWSSPGILGHSDPFLTSHLTFEPVSRTLRFPFIC